LNSSHLGIGETIRGTTLGAVDTVASESTALNQNDAVAFKGRDEIERGKANLEGGGGVGNANTPGGGKWEHDNRGGKWEHDNRGGKWEHDNRGGKWEHDNRGDNGAFDNTTRNAADGVGRDPTY
jgi:hypothetical protein